MDDDINDLFDTLVSALIWKFSDYLSDPEYDKFFYS